MSYQEDYAAMKEPGATTMPLQKPARFGRFSSRTVIFVGVAAALIVIGLAVGLGVGLGIGHGNGGGNDESQSPPISTPIPPPTGNGTVWQPAVNSTWQIVLKEPIKISAENKTTEPDVEIFDIDLFSNSNETIRQLHDLGKKVICYFSGGSYEPYRPDSSQFQLSVLGKALDGWDDEKWIDIRSESVRDIMAARIKLAYEKGCDAVDPDNVDAYVRSVQCSLILRLMLTMLQNNENGLDLTQADTVSFMAYLANVTNSYNMSVGLKNAGEVLTNLTSVVHFSVNEQCVQYKECETFAPMIQAGKPVFHIEYPRGAPGGISGKTAASSCSRSGAGQGSDDFSSLLKGELLDGWVEFCDRSTANTTMISERAV